MTTNQLTINKFFNQTDMTPEEAVKIVTNGLDGSDYGEFYLEASEAEAIVKTAGEFKSISFGNSESGFGFRYGQGENTAYVYSDIFNKAALDEAIATAKSTMDTKKKGPQPLQGFGGNTQEFYKPKHEADSHNVEEKIRIIDKIESEALASDPNVINASVIYKSAAKDVLIITNDGQILTDERPMSSMTVTLSLKGDDGKIYEHYSTIGGRVGPDDVLDEANYRPLIEDVLRTAKLLSIAEEAPSGKADVVLKSGWPAVLLHEAVGHGLESDHTRDETSVYSGKIGEQVAAKGVTIVDQGDMPGERGGLPFDDEGTPTQRNVLVEDGILKAYMQDRKNALLTGEQPTGNGRRESYKHAPMPRMTNTYFESGEHTPEEVLASLKDGIYVESMGGGSVDTTSGKFNMEVTLGWIVKDGKKIKPIKGASVIGDGLTTIQNTVMVANDLELARSSGMCGKGGQSVPAGIGQPTIRVNGMTIGGQG
ncbi:MAG: metalloprotease TldD [Micavibrio sp.]|nr:metalloprotease TldD [Micavibrio sp.]